MYYDTVIDGLEVSEFATDMVHTALKAKEYWPAPIDTSRVTLTEDIRKLTELLAKNAHEVWAQQRLAEGWHYGPVRHDARKEHPCLVPYEELPESEKDYDRNTAMQTLKAIVALGYRIESVTARSGRKPPLGNRRKTDAE